LRSFKSISSKIFIAIFIFSFLFTRVGVYIAYGITKTFVDISVNDLKGSLISGVSFNNFKFSSLENKVIVNRAKINWNLFKSNYQLSIKANTVIVINESVQNETQDISIKIPHVNFWPINKLHIKDASIKEIQIYTSSRKTKIESLVINDVISDQDFSINKLHFKLNGLDCGIGSSFVMKDRLGDFTLKAVNEANQSSYTINVTLTPENLMLKAKLLNFGDYELKAALKKNDILLDFKWSGVLINKTQFKKGSLLITNKQPLSVYDIFNNNKKSFTLTYSYGASKGSGVLDYTDKIYLKSKYESGKYDINLELISSFKKGISFEKLEIISDEDYIKLKTNNILTLNDLSLDLKSLDLGKYGLFDSGSISLNLNKKDNDIQLKSLINNLSIVDFRIQNLDANVGIKNGNLLSNSHLNLNQLYVLGFQVEKGFLKSALDNNFSLSTEGDINLSTKGSFKNNLLKITDLNCEYIVNITGQSESFINLNTNEFELNLKDDENNTLFLLGNFESPKKYDFKTLINIKNKKIINNVDKNIFFSAQIDLDVSVFNNNIEKVYGKATIENVTVNGLNIQKKLNLDLYNNEQVIGLKVTSEDGPINIAGNLVYYSKNIAFNNIITTNVFGNLNISLIDLSFLENLQARFDDIRGSLYSKLKFSGNFISPIVNGSIYLNDLTFFSHINDIRFKDINVSCRVDKSIGKLNGEILSEQGKMNLTSKFNLTNLDFNLDFKTQDFLLMDTNHFKIIIDSDLRINSNDDIIDAIGNLTVKDSIIDLSNNINVESLNNDVRLDSSSYTDFLNFEYDINLSIKNLEFNGYNANVIAEGDLSMKNNEDLVDACFGKIVFKSGEYLLLGKVIDIEKNSNVYYDGQPITVPKLDITASKIFNNADSSNANDLVNKVGVKLSGAIDNMQTNFFSSPTSLSEENIISYIVFGEATSDVFNSSGLLAIIASYALASKQKSSLGGEQVEKSPVNKIKDALAAYGIQVDLVNKYTNDFSSFDSINNSYKSSKSTVLRIKKPILSKLDLSAYINILRIKENDNLFLTLQYQLYKNLLFTTEINPIRLSDSLSFLINFSN